MSPSGRFSKRDRDVVSTGCVSETSLWRQADGVGGAGLINGNPRKR